MPRAMELHAEDAEGAEDRGGLIADCRFHAMTQPGFHAEGADVLADCRFHAKTARTQRRNRDFTPVRLPPVAQGKLRR